MGKLSGKRKVMFDVAVQLELTSMIKVEVWGPNCMMSMHFLVTLVEEGGGRGERD